MNPESVSEFKVEAPVGELIVTLTVKGVKLSRATGVLGLFGIQLDKDIHAQDLFAEIPFVQGMT